MEKKQILIKNPKSISKLTSIEKKDHYIVYDFVSDHNTKTYTFDENPISVSDAIKSIKHGSHVGYVFDKNVKFTDEKDFKINDNSKITVVSAFTITSILLLLIAK